jgi:hypothetical protein
LQSSVHIVESVSIQVEEQPTATVEQRGIERDYPMRRESLR